MWPINSVARSTTACNNGNDSSGSKVVVDHSTSHLFSPWYNVLMVMAMQVLLPNIWQLLLNVVFVRRVYKSAADFRQTMDVLDALSQLPRTLRICEQRMQGRNVAKVLICSRAFVTCEMSLVGLHGDAAVEVTIWRFPWAYRDPVVPDPAPIPTPTGKCIKVLQRSSNRTEDSGHMSSVVESVHPIHGIPQEILEGADSAATAMFEAFRANGCASTVFVLHGKAGSGKSTAVRMLAHKVGAILYADYNPTQPSDNLRMLMSDYVSESQTLVIAYEECDVSLEHIKNKEVTAPAGYRLDASDKASWNNLIDTIKRRYNVIMVMTTNRSKEELESLCDEHKSMLRKGRVDAHFIWYPGCAPVMLPSEDAMSSESDSASVGASTPPLTDTINGAD